MTIKERFQKYKEKKNTFSIASDIVFILLLVALAFPSSRMAVVSTIKRITLFAPSAIAEENRVQLNSTAYQWEYNDLSGNKLHFVENQNKVVFLNFWATWCPPCVAEMPSIQNLYDQYGQQIAFVVASDENPEKIKAFMEKKGFTFPVHIYKYAPPKELQTSTLPTTFLISKEGEIVMKKKGAAKWNSKRVKKLIEELIEK